MKVTDASRLEADNGALTLAKLDSRFPNTNWSEVEIEGSRYKADMIFGADLDAIAIHGLIDPVGKEIQFV